MLLTISVVCGFAGHASADVIMFGGQITQSTQDGTGPAVNIPALNNILDGDAYSVVIDFAGSITAAGTYDLTGSALTFSDPTASAIESNFAAISLTITPNGGFFDLSLLACLTTGTSCAASNQLDANFRLLAANLNSLSTVSATGLDPPHPLDLLEDDGTTDIQASITGYSYTGRVSAVPEPSAVALLGMVLAVMASKNLRRRR